jgi:hypothetical protein
VVWLVAWLIGAIVTFIVIDSDNLTEDLFWGAVWPMTWLLVAKDTLNGRMVWRIKRKG